MPIAVHKRRDLSDSIREKPDPRLPGREGSRGGGARDNRRLVNAVFRIIRAGAPWRDPPPDFGGWSDTRRRFIRWRDNGVRERPPEIPIDDPDPAWLMIDTGHCGVHPHAAGARGGNRDMIRAKGGSTQNRIWPRMRMACRSGLLSHGGATVDCARTIAPIDGFAAERLLADKGRDTDEILARTEKQGMEALIPRRKAAGSGAIATGSLAGPGT